MDKKLHIVSFDVPWPVNYGGVIDVYHKIRALHAAGIQVHLHCFEYGDRTRNTETEKYCYNVSYYKRLTGIQGISLLRPYIVNSRKNALLLKNLLADTNPILFEGLHTCFYLNHPALKGRKKYVRTHNVEHDYYKGLADVEPNWYKRWYFNMEASLLKRYEIILKEATGLFCISENDTAYFSKFGLSICAPAFHGNDAVHVQLGEGAYCFYHGNLAVAENEHAAIELIDNVFSKIELKTVIAGANPSSELVNKIAGFDSIELVSNPDATEMTLLKKDAHIHVLYSAQGTGVKLKLLDSLCLGRFVVANDAVLINDNLKHAAIEVTDWAGYIEKIDYLRYEIFQHHDLQERERIVQGAFSNKKNAQIIIDRIFT